jgi:predicted RNA-binding Zn ribbon-like protein
MSESDPDHDWSFEEGKLPLDFANTNEWRTSDHPQEMLNEYADLVDWSRHADLITEAEARTLLAEAARDPLKSAQALEKAIKLRETIYAIFSNHARGQAPRSMDLAFLNALLSEAGTRAQIASKSDGFEWVWVADEGPFDRMLWQIARSTADLLTSEDLERVGECADVHGCSWLFFDTSRNRSRRWCSMDSCGNRAKARRHYKRQTEKQSV